MPVPEPQFLSLPEAFLLLAHPDSGRVSDARRTAAGCAAAELGELALRGRLVVRSRKSKKFGFDVYHGRGRIELVDAGGAGSGDPAWAGEVLAELARRSAAGPKPPAADRWLRARGGAALALHRGALTDRRMLRHEPGVLLRRERRHPDFVVRNTLINELRAAYGGRSPLTTQLLFLGDLVEGAGLSGELRLALTWRQRLDHGRGTAVAHLPEELRDTSRALGFAIPARNDGG
ncbi:GPP34 family phosphoprotein [Streptomyces sp. NPDC050161]|uniref:GOLPH3/VPS74 family protein n=1 Tax=Streptomyces sp. NPDC050161 TaxID=3365604 RepID=UPI0037B54AB7